MALQLVQWDDVSNKYKRGGAAPDFRANSSAVGLGVTSLVITFSSALPNANYVVVPAWMNTSGGFPQQQPLIVTVFSTTGFTVTWSAPTDTTSYKINWIVMQQG